VTLAKQVMDDLIKFGKVRRAVIGVQINNASAVDAKAAGMKEVTGVVVSAYSLDPSGNSPAKTAGIQPGDVIIAADGKAADRVSTLQRVIRSHKPGETVSLDVMHFGEKKSFKVRLIEAPESSQVASAESSGPAIVEPTSQAKRFDKVGITAEPVSPALISRARLEEQYRHGLMVSEVSVTGPAYHQLEADNTILLQVLNPGPKRDLKSVADLDDVLSRLHPGDVVTFLVYDVRQNPLNGNATRAISLEVSR
jgi:serine protease Do